MKILSIDHIGIAVKNINQALDFYRRGLGLELGGIEEIPERNLKAGFINVGATKIELLESTSDDSAIAKYIAKKGEGIHHICLLVDDIAEALEHFKAEGFELIDSQPRGGAEGSKVAFIHPKAAGGALIELKQLFK